MRMVSWMAFFSGISMLFARLVGRGGQRATVDVDIEPLPPRVVDERPLEQLEAEALRLRDKWNAGRDPAIRKRMTEMFDAISAKVSAGADPCPLCGRVPMGMRKNTRIFEVGCGVCRPKMIEIEGRLLRRSVAAQGFSPEEAVQKWNAGVWRLD